MAIITFRLSFLEGIHSPELVSAHKKWDSCVKKRELKGEVQNLLLLCRHTPGQSWHEEGVSQIVGSGKLQKLPDAAPPTVGWVGLGGGSGAVILLNKDFG